VVSENLGWEGSSDLRVSDAERQDAIQRLRAHLTDGRLSLEEFSDRVAEAHSARTHRELDHALRELPADGGDDRSSPASDVQGRRRREDIRNCVAAFVMPNLVCTGIWALTSHGHAYFWPGWVLFGTALVFIKKILHGRPEEEVVSSAHVPEGHTESAPSAVSAAHQGRQPPEVPGFERTVATLLFVDIVGSTERAAALGDVRWRELLDEYRALCSKELRHWCGREVFTKGDELVAAFDSPERAIRCACALRDDARSVGLRVRAGLHAGEVDRRADDVSGIAVHTGQRVSANAAPDEVLVSATVKELVAGSDICFADAGDHQLKGLSGSWHLYSVADPGGQRPPAGDHVQASSVE